MGVYELLTVTDEIRQLIVEKATARELLHVAVEQGMRTMQMEGFRLVAEGVTTVEDLLRSVYPPGMDSDAEAEPAVELPPEAANGNGSKPVDMTTTGGTVR